MAISKLTNVIHLNIGGYYLEPCDETYDSFEKFINLKSLKLCTGPLDDATKMMGLGT